MSASSAPLQLIRHQPSFVLETPEVRLAMTRTGGHMGPVEFLRTATKPFQPYFVAPWADEGCDPATDVVLQVLRGDFFCCPFGGNSVPYKNEKHPVHGESANNSWTLEEWDCAASGARMRLSMQTAVRPARIEKTVSLVPGENVVYMSNVISGMSGQMNFGHHATLGFPDTPNCARISFSPRRFAQVYYAPTEKPEEKGYSILKPGAIIDDLARVPRADGLTADLTRYPARRGFEDIAIVCSQPDLPFGWTAVHYETLGAIWFSLKDPAVLPSTLMWHSNGGRHFPPWSGRNINCLGLEDILGYFHDGIAGSCGDNDLAARGIPTSQTMDPKKPTAIHYIQGAAPAPAGFGAVTAIEASGARSIRLIGESGAKIEVPVRLDFLKDGVV